MCNCNEEIFVSISGEEQLNYLNNHFNQMNDDQRIRQGEIEDLLDELYLEVSDEINESENVED